MRSFLYIALALCFVKLTNCDCTINLNEFPKTQPVYIQDGGFLAPNREGKIVFKESEIFLVGCPGRSNHVLLGKDVANNTLADNTVEAKCVRAKTFQVGGWQGTFSSIKCRASPYVDSVKTSVTCFGGSYIYKVGFTVSSKFYKLYELCFDVDTAATVYSHHNIGPSSSYRQAGGRPAFSENGMFETTAVADVYKSKNQKTRLDRLLGEGMGDKYIKNNQFLARGHLSPRADFPLLSLQRATFLYANVAPQWTRSNGGDWASLEDAIRDRVKKYGKEIQVYTGTHSVEQLYDKNGKLTEIYLDVDRNNNNIVPVPLYFYKVIYDSLHKKATAFVQINSSFFKNEVTRNLTFCDDICENNPKLAWVKWRDNDGTTSFCCDFKQFSKTVKHFDFVVKDVFY